jgi:beta-glucanase (GH16 family)
VPRPVAANRPATPGSKAARPVQTASHERKPLTASKRNRPRARIPRLALAALLVLAVTALAAACTAAPPPPVSSKLAPSLTVPPPSASATPAGGPGPATPAGIPANMKLAFSTDFPGTALDTSTWAECYPWSPAPPGCSNFGNSDEREWYLPSQVHVTNGALALVAQRTPTEGSDEQGNPEMYTCRSGMVTTYHSFNFKYGVVQVTARLPFGKGLWPAIWLIPADGSWPPEIDIVEHWDTQPTARATLHYGSDNAQQRGTVTFPQADQGWHTYTLYWTQSRITIYYDSTLALTTTTHIPQQPMYLLLDLADENAAPGSCSGTMYVKSVNIWDQS